MIKEEKSISNRWLFMSIVGAVLLTTITLFGSIIFNIGDNPDANVPELLASIGSTALGVLVGLVIPSSLSK